jgi:hypothetical protein
LLEQLAIVIVYFKDFKTPFVVVKIKQNGKNEKLEMRI